MHPQGPSPRQREDLLTAAIAQMARRGWHVEQRHAAAATLAKGRPYKPSHLVHLLGTIFTCGLWLPGWVIATLFSGRQARRPVAVDQAGQVLKTRVRG